MLYGYVTSLSMLLLASNPKVDWRWPRKLDCRNSIDVAYLMAKPKLTSFFEKNALQWTWKSLVGLDDRNT